MTVRPDIATLSARAGEVSALLKLLSHPNRLLIACKLTAGEACVSDLEAAIGAAQPTLSRDLARMREEGLLASRRQSKSVYYRLADDRLARVIGALCDAFGPHKKEKKSATRKSPGARAKAPPASRQKARPVSQPARRKRP